MTGIAATLGLSGVAMKFNRRRYNPLNSDLQRALEVTRDALEGVGAKFAMIGGLAYGHYVTVRATDDLDIILMAAAQSDATNVFAALEQAGFEPDRHPDGRIRTGYLNHLRAYTLAFTGPNPLRVRVDIIASANEFFSKAVQEGEFDNDFGVYVASIESVIIMKWLSRNDRFLKGVDIATRLKGEQDGTDCKNLLFTQKWDESRLRQYCKLLDVNFEELPFPI